MIRALLLSCFYFIFCVIALGQTHFTVTEDIKEAYRYASSLRKEKAITLIDKIKSDDPDNMLVYHVENYLDFFDVFINEDESQFKQLEKNKNLRIRKIKSGPKDSPFYLFSEAEINLQWALARSKFDEKLNAGRELYRAYGLLEENKKRFPDFSYNDKSLSIIHVLARSIPGIIRKLFSIEGSITKGTKEIAELYQKTIPGELFYDEIQVIYAYILYYQNNQRSKAWKVLEKAYVGKKIENPLVSFITANMAQKTGNTDLAIDILKNRPKGGAYMDFYYLDFLQGKFMLYSLDPDAESLMLAYLENFNGRHFIKEAYQKLAWYHLIIKDDLAAYKKFMNTLKDRGDDLIDEDKQAQKEAKSKKIPHPNLLEARLLYDGGYYEKAHNILIKKAVMFYDTKDLLEYNYRMGRITQALKNYPDAILYFSQTLNTKEKKSHYLCNAALQIGLIMEEQNKPKQALEYLERCLDYSPNEYKNSLHQKAKSARDRIKEKRK